MEEKILTISFIFYNDDIKIIERNIQEIYGLIDEIDILIVDDHSRYENYEEIKNLINSKYPKVSLHRNEKNLNIAKNGLKSLKLAKTKYVKRVDGDDLISSKKEVQKLINYLKDEKNDFDIAFNSWYYKTKRKKRKIKDNTKLVMFNTNVIYRTNFIKDFEHPEKVTSFLEDKSMILLMISKKNPNIKTIDIPIYIYLGRGSSAVSDILKRKEKYIEIFFDILKNIKLDNLSNKNKNIILYQISRILSFIYILMYGEDRKNKKRVYNELKEKIININSSLWNELENFNSWKLNYLKLNYLNGHNIFLPIIYSMLFKEKPKKRK